MDFVLTFTFFLQSTLSLIFGITVFTQKERNSFNIVFTALAMFISLWGFGEIIVLNSGTNENIRHFGGGMLMFGLLMSIVSAVCMSAELVKASGKATTFIKYAEILVFLIIYPVMASDDTMSFVKTEYGYSVAANGVKRLAIYNIAVIIAMLTVLAFSAYGYIVHKRKRERLFAKVGFMIFTIMVCAYVANIYRGNGRVHTFLPITSILMFMCLVMVYMHCIKWNSNLVTVENVSRNLFTIIDTPVFLLDENCKICAVNEAAVSFIDTIHDKITGRTLDKFFDMDLSLIDSTESQVIDVKSIKSGRDCRLSYNNITDSYGDYLGCIVTMVDMTDKIQLIDKLENLQNHLTESLNKKTAELSQLTLEAITAIANTIDAKDEYTKGHSQRVAQYSVALARKIGFDDDFVMRIHYIALLHDIGKIGVPDSILNKPGRLNDSEFMVLKQHTTMGAAILKDITVLPNVAMGAKSHHERFDGRGYPDGLKGMEIPLEARIVAVADAFDAMTSNRCYRKKLSKEYVMSELIKGKGTQFTPEFAEAFIELINEGVISAFDENNEGVSKDGKSAENTGGKSDSEDYEIDLMTRTYTKKSGEKYISQLLKSDRGCMMIIDIDNFKSVNDRLGHLAGDMTLKAVAECIRKNMPENAVLCRQGGDEFLLFIPGASFETAASAIEQRIRSAYNEMPETIGTSLSIGAAFSQLIGESFEQLFSKSDKALYYVKQNGRNGFYIFNGNAYSDSADSTDSDMEHILSIFRGQAQYVGMFKESVDKLIETYHMCRGISLVLFTAEVEGSTGDVESTDNAIKNLDTACMESIENSEAYSRYSYSQVIAVFMESQESDIRGIAEKIIQKFYRLQNSSDIKLHYAFSKLFE